MARQIIQRVGGGSLSGQVRDAILDSITQNRFAEGRLPAESELALLLGVSRTTLRAALQSLELDGFIARAPGRGTTVLKHTKASLGLHRLTGFSKLLEETGYECGVDITLEQTHDPSADAVDKLGISRDEECWTARKLFTADGHPAIWLYDLYPTRHFRRIPSSKDKVPDSIFAFSQLYFHEEIDHAVAEIVPRTADSKVARRLRVRVGSPYLYLMETHYSALGKPLAFSGLYVNDRYVRFHVFRRKN